MKKLAYLASCLILSGCGTVGLFGSKKADAPEVVTTPKIISSNDKEGIRSDLCPELTVRDGAAVMKTGGDSPLEVKYQASIGEMARECQIEGNIFRIKLGVEGRVVVGPKGSLGTMTLPIRIALVKGLDQPVWSKLYRVNVAVKTSNQSFEIIENDLSIPLPRPEELQNMRVYVGFDPKGDMIKEKKKTR